MLEIIIALGIFVIISMIGADFVINNIKALRLNSAKENLFKDSRRVSKIIEAELREARHGEQGSYALALAQNQSLEFFSDNDSDGKAELIKYALVNGVLKKTSIEPGTDNEYSGAGNTAVLLEGLDNEANPLFVFYNQNNAQTSRINNISLVKLVFQIDRYKIERTVKLRNI